MESGAATESEIERAKEKAKGIGGMLPCQRTAGKVLRLSTST